MLPIEPTQKEGTVMELTWSLDVLYRDLDDPALEADFQKLEEAITGMKEALNAAKTASPEDGLTAVLTAWETEAVLDYRIGNYLYLRQSTDASNGAIASLLARYGRISASAAPIRTAIQHFIASIDHLEEITAKTPFLSEYRFLCLQIQQQAPHLLPDETEALLSELDLSGGGAWSKLFDYLTANVPVSLEGKTITLPEVRNLAHHPDQAMRKKAYEAELACYPAIEGSIAFALNSIKNQVWTVAKKRGFESPLTMTLDRTHMSRETLDAMLLAMNEEFSIFHRYLRAKARRLGHPGGLPWYDLFAPMGESSRTYTPEEAKETLVSAFSALAPDTGALIEEAFDHRWIDFLPKKGKVGGAYCANLPETDESRILTNFSGDYESVVTLAHELGHAYHNRMIQNRRPLNQDFPMQVAETASTFQEVHLGLYALAHAKTDGERLALLESMLSGTTQTMCDIYSRYLFESEVFARCQTEFLMPDTLCDIMARAQRTAYGDGLDEQALHPYMWACKGHYYSSDLSFYNFPYAFGTLFSTGLYALYQKEGEAFLEKYRALLNATPVSTVEEIGALAGVDLTKPDFWRQSLAVYAKLADEYEALTR